MQGPALYWDMSPHGQDLLLALLANHRELPLFASCPPLWENCALELRWPSAAPWAKGQGPLTRLHGDSGFLVTGSFALLDFETHPPWSSAHK